MSNQAAPLADHERTQIIIGVLITMFLAALDQTVVSPALPTISAALGGELWLSWVVSAYLLTSTAFTPLFGKLADLRGRRAVLYSCVAVFLAGSLICALASTMAVLIVGRAIQGIGDGGLKAVGQTIIADVVPTRERPRYLQYTATLWAVSSIAGPVVGGALAENVHWSMIFWINLPIGAVSYLLSARALAKFPEVRRHHQLDVMGLLMVIIATVLLLVALTLGGSVYPWSSLTICGLICASLLLFGLFGWYQLRSGDPLLPLRVLANPIIAYASAAAFFSMTCIVGLSVYFPAYLQLVEGSGAAASGLPLVALMSGAWLGSNIAGRFMRKPGHYKWVAVVGACVATVALLLLGLLAGKASFAVTEAAVAAAGVGVGTLFPIALTSVQVATPRRDLGIATAMFIFSRSLGAVVSLAALSAIVAATGIAPHIGSSEIDPDARAQIADGFGWMFYAAASSQVLSLLFLVRMEEKPLHAAAIDSE